MTSFHIVVLRFSSLGDLVLASSLPRAIHERWGKRVRVTLLTSAAFVPLFTEVTWADQVIPISRTRGAQGLSELIRTIRKIQQQQPIDLFLDMHGSLRSLFIRLVFWKISRIFVDKRTIERWLLTMFKIDFLSGQRPGSRRPRHGELLLERNIVDFSGIFDLKPEALTPRPLSDCSLPVSTSFQNIEGPYICFAPSASFPEKRWSAQRFLELMEKMIQDQRFQGVKLVVLAGKEDQFCEIFNALTERFPGRFLNLQGKTSLAESALILKNSLMCVGNDTGLPHIAEALAVPVVVILGPTGEEFGFYPHLSKSRTVMKSLWCRPCTTNGKGNCIRSQRFCLTEITVDEVFSQVCALRESL